MAVFENESNASQDANYREHLNRNWDNGNIAFDNIYRQISNWQRMFTDLSNQLSAVTSRVTTLESENDKRIQENVNLRNELTQYELKTDQRLQRLEAAIFNAEYINDTDDKPDVDHSTKVSEINDDIVPDPSTNDSSAVVIESDNDAVIPDKIN
jgi:regulator of replication initiation timing